MNIDVIGLNIFGHYSRIHKSENVIIYLKTKTLPMQCSQTAN